MGDKEDYLTSYRLFFENFAANVNPDDQLPVNSSEYSITEAELPGNVIYWTIEYLRERSCPATLVTPLLRKVLDEVRIAAKKDPYRFGYSDGSLDYSTLSLMIAVIGIVNAICKRYLDNSQLDTLPPPPRTQKEYLTVSAALRNIRRVMEDRHVEIANLEALYDIETTEHTSFYAVYDGHAGSSAAQYCAEHLHQHLVDSKHFKKNLRKALREAFLRTDAEFIRRSNSEFRNGHSSGSTAVVICIRGKRLLVAWVGDSQALIAERMHVMQLVNPHKPSREDEKNRIEASGGTVMFWGTWRVNGQLAVSRAIGDARYKPYVTANPDQGTLDLDGDEDFVVIACDGLWDVVSEDAVALTVYRQITANPDDLQAVTERLIRQAKREGSQDNISIIVVFLKDPRDIAAQNCPPMELGLDNAVVSPPLRPFDVDDKVNVAEAAGGEDNGVSDSDSEDLGPETAVDVDPDDGDVEMRNPAPPTPPAHAVEASHIDGNLVDNVAESGEESEDEWNYFKGEGEPEQNPSEEADEAPRSETPCQDNSAWESSSVDMNSSPLNPDAPVFVPGGVAGSDVLLAESPRKPLPMEDIEVPDVKQFETEAGGRPAELQDLDNCDHLNGHHNISIEGVTAHLNGNTKCDMDSFEFNGLESDKIKESSLIQDFERIQKDTTDFCNIQVFQTQSETNPFSIESNDDLFERLKNKERDPMSMSFYQEKDDDTCERFGKSEVDLNSVQPLPDSEDEDLEENGECQHVVEQDKENVHPEQHTNLFSLPNNDVEPNNDILRFDERNDITENNVAIDNVECNVECTNMQNYSNIDFECRNQENVMPTDTPESHKLLFEQIPEIPDGKSSELGFSNDDLLDPSESEKDNVSPQDLSQDDEMGVQQEETEMQNDLPLDTTEHMQTFIEHSDVIEQESEIVSESPINVENDKVTPEPIDFGKLDSEGIENNVVVDVHQSEKDVDEFETENKQFDRNDLVDNDMAIMDTPQITLNNEVPYNTLTKTPEPVDFMTQSPLPETDHEENVPQKDESMPRHSPLPEDLLSKSPQPSEGLMFGESPVPAQSPLPSQSPLIPEETHSPIPTQDVPLIPAEVPLPQESPAPSDIDDPERQEYQASPLPVEQPPPEEPVQENLPVETNVIETEVTQESVLIQSPELLVEAKDTLPIEETQPCESPLPVEEAAPKDSISVNESITPRESPLPVDEFVSKESPLPVEDVLIRDSPVPQQEELINESPTPQQEELQKESPVPQQEELVKESPVPQQEELEKESNVPQPEELVKESPVPQPEELITESPVPSQDVLISESPVPQRDSVAIESPVPEEQPPVKSPQPDIKDSIAQDTTEPLVHSPLPVENIQNDLFDVQNEPVDALVDESAPLETKEPEVKEEHREVIESAPAPDIVSEHPRVDLINDIDMGITESRAQEICVPVTSEIPNVGEEIPPATTPPPTPAVLLSEPPLGDSAPVEPLAAAALAGAVAAVAATAAVATAAATPKTAPKKSSPTPTLRSKTASKTPTPAKTPASATKRPTSTTTTPRAAAPKPAAPKASAPAAKTAKPSSPTKAAPKPLTPAKEAPVAAKTAPKPAAARPATKPPATKTPAPKAPAAKTTTAPKAPSAAPRVPAAKPAPRPAAPKPAAPAAKTAPATKAAPAAPKSAPITRTVPKTTATRTSVTAPKPKAPEKKPLTNGDVKPAAKPAPKPAAPAARPVPKPAPRAPAAAPAKPAAAKPATRTILDKQSKDLANKRITAKTAPPRTAPVKSTTANKVKSVPKKSEKETIVNGMNGSAEEEMNKPPASPPIDNALLPDVIA